MSNSDHHANRVTYLTLIITMGIVFGDIGTSPLYVLRSLVGKAIVTPELIYGGLSCIFWTLTFVTTIKYVIVILRADNHGEGGTLSLYALVRKRYKYLVFAAAAGAATLLADSIITPPISISAAIEGLGFSRNITIQIVILIIVGLFSIQQFGTNTIGKAFGPIMFLWFITLGFVGGWQVIQHPQILMAFSPYYALNFLINYNGFLLLGAVFLCTTGAEALYSDLGHCGRQNIRISWVFVKITLLLNYFGQGAWILSHYSGEIMPPHINPFYSIFTDISPELKLPAVALATVAAIIASQALISGSFTLISEAIQLNLFPKIQINYPSDIKGQLYIPLVNWMLCFGCISIVLYFQHSSRMEAAYGLTVTLAMLMATTLLMFYLHLNKVNKILIFLLISMFYIIEGSFLMANVGKIPHGGWFTLLISAILFSVMYAWYRARKIKNSFHKFESVKKYLPALGDLRNDITVPKYATHLVFLTSADDPYQVESKIIYSIFNKQPKRADVYWLVHIHNVDQPTVQECSYVIMQTVEDELERIEKEIAQMQNQVPEKIDLSHAQTTIATVNNEKNEWSALSKVANNQTSMTNNNENVNEVDVVDFFSNTFSYKANKNHATVIRVEFKLGFKVQPRINLFMRYVVDKLVADGKIDPISRYPSLRKHHIKGDFRFVVTDRILSSDVVLPTFDGLIMNIYSVLKYIGISDEKAFGLDTSSVTVEKVPLVLPNTQNIHFAFKNEHK